MEFLHAKKWFRQPTTLAAKLLKFSLRVGSRFFRNHGFLLSSAVAYNAMLSIIPLCVLLLVLLAGVFSDEVLHATLSEELAVLVPGLEVILTEVLAAFPENRELIGWIGLAALIFFSTMAFRILETAMQVIFHRPTPTRKKTRKFWISAILPYLFVLAIGVALIIITMIRAALQAAPFDEIRLFGHWLSLDVVTTTLVHLLGAAGLVFLFTALYAVMPVVKIRFRRALIGGVVATLFWEVTRVILGWFFVNVSLVNLVYGSLATMVIVLISMEVAAVIVLLAAQVIAELEHSSEHELPWFEE